MEQKNALFMKNITKQFFGVTVLDDVDFEVRAGEIHGLLGENGAGKSTLMKILNGALAPTKGSIIIDGKEIKASSPIEAKAAGIAMVYQELNLFPHLSVAENICAECMPRTKVGLVDWKAMKEIANAQLERMKIKLDVSERLDKLSVAQQQIVAIVRALIGECKVLILDEPTSALPKADVKDLFEVMHRLKSEGIAIIFISHKLDEVLEITDRLTILNNGHKVNMVETNSVSEKELAEMIVGKDIKNKYPKQLFEPGEEILRFEHVSVENKLNDISFNLRKGEVLGIVGLMGAGKTEIAKLIFGALVNDKKVIQGKIHIFGEERVFGSPIEAVKNGIGLISENRADEGLLLIHDIKMNISTPALRILSKNGFVKEKEEKNVVQDLITRLQIKCGSYSQLVRSLSGGNQQKVVIAKWFASRAKLVLFDEPTRGIDVGAKVDGPVDKSAKHPIPMV